MQLTGSSISASGKLPWLINELPLKPQWQAPKGLPCLGFLIHPARKTSTLEAGPAGEMAERGSDGSLPCPALFRGGQSSPAAAATHTESFTNPPNKEPYIQSVSSQNNCRDRSQRTDQKGCGFWVQKGKVHADW